MDNQRSVSTFAWGTSAGLEALRLVLIGKLTGDAFRIIADEMRIKNPNWLDGSILLLQSFASR